MAKKTKVDFDTIRELVETIDDMFGQLETEWPSVPARLKTRMATLMSELRTTIDDEDDE